MPVTIGLDPVKNFAKTTVSTGYDAAAVSVALRTGHGARLPDPSTDGAFNLVWYDTYYPNPSDDPNVEIVRCTARSSDTLTVTRGQESTSASTKNTVGRTYSMILAPTKKMIDDIGDFFGRQKELQQAVMNGEFLVWQLGTSFTNPASQAITADRFKINWNLGGGASWPTNIIHSKQTLDPTVSDEAALLDEGVKYYYRVNVDGAGASFGDNTYYLLQHFINNGVRKLCGNGKQVTLTIKARSNIVGKKLATFLLQNYGTGGSPTTQEALLGTTWNLTSTFTDYSCTFTTNTQANKTFGSNGDDALKLQIVYAWEGPVFGAANFNNSTTETFIGAGNIDIAEIRLCAGNKTLKFIPSDLADVLRQCKRYRCSSFPYGTAAADAAGVNGSEHIRTQATDSFHNFPNIKLNGMRTAPAITLYNPSASSADDIRNETDSTNHPSTVGEITADSFRIYVNNSSINAAKDLDVHWVANAEH